VEQPTWPCPSCGHDTEFEQPICIDGHTDDGGECPEWACVECGTALVSGDAAPASVTRAASRGRAAQQFAVGTCGAAITLEPVA
jgi:hypothetical protein